MKENRGKIFYDRPIDYVHIIFNCDGQIIRYCLQLNIFGGTPEEERNITSFVNLKLKRNFRILERLTIFHKYFNSFQPKVPAASNLYITIKVILQETTIFHTYSYNHLVSFNSNRHKFLYTGIFFFIYKIDFSNNCRNTSDNFNLLIVITVG